MKDSHTNFLSRLFSLAAAVLFLIALWEWILELFGYTLSWISYASGRLFEFAVMMMIFAIGLLLRQIRDAVRK